MMDTVQMKVAGLMCSFCTMSVEKALKRYPGVKSVMVNLVHGIILVEVDTSQTSRENLAAAVEKLGYDVAATEVQQYATEQALHKLIKRRGTIGMIVSAIDLLVDPIDVLALPEHGRAWFSFAVALFVLLWVGFPILRKTLLAVRQGVINANVLLSAAAWGSLVVGMLSLFDARWPNFSPVAAWLMSLHLFFGFFKLDTRKKAAEAVRKLLSLQPSRARVLRADAEVDVLTKDVAVGEVIVVRPGERIALDGQVVEGTASVDESSFTGESVPSTKEGGLNVIGGTLNLDGLLCVRVTKIGQDSFISQIVRLMSQIAERKPPIELLADRLMNYYGPVVFVAAALAFSGWALETGNWIAATLAGLTTLIMGYPCALGISTPMLAAIAGGKGISVGLLVKASEVFHELSLVDTVVFDKTGTLTYGRPTVTDVQGFNIERAELLGIALAIEGPSEHPLAQAVSFYAKREGATPARIRDFRAMPGQGVIAALEDGTELIAAKLSFIEERGVQASNEARAATAARNAEGKTVVVFARGGEIIGIMGLQDQPRRSAARLMGKLRARSIRTVMLTGDSEHVAAIIGSQLGMDDIRAELLPAHKAAAIQALQSDGRKVAMVGDGINDAPALAQANVGIAIGAGTDVAIESAGVILVGDRLDDVLNALELGKASYRTLTGNVAIAVQFNVGGMMLAALGWVTPLLAVSVMILSIFAILLNTLRIRTLSFEREADEERGPLAEVEYVVTSMVCEGCAERITDAVRALPGVREVRPKVQQKHVYIQYEPKKVKEPELKAAIGRVGFVAVEA